MALRNACGSQKDADASELLFKATGQRSLKELGVDILKPLLPALDRLSSGEAYIQQAPDKTNVVVDASSSAILYPPGYAWPQDDVAQAPAVDPAVNPQQAVDPANEPPPPVEDTPLQDGAPPAEDGAPAGTGSEEEEFWGDED